MNTPENTPPPEQPDRAPEHPARTILAAFFRRPEYVPPRIRTLSLILRLLWPLAMLGGGIALFVIIGANGWLWLVLGLIIVCGIFARPPKFPDGHA